jgi:hypothetical protein
LNGLTRARAHELTRALRDDVNLVLRVRRLRVRSARRVELDDHRSMLEQQDRLLTLRSRQTRKRIGKIHLKTFAQSHGDATDNTLQCAANKRWE